MNKIFTILLITLSTILFAQDQVAKSVLDKLSTTTKSYKNIIIHFDFILKNTSQNINESQKGVLTLEDDDFRLEMDGQIIINNGENQWVYLTEVNEVQITEHDPEDNIMSPSKLFAIYEEDYKYTYVGAKTEKGKRLEIVDLFPEESGAFIKVTLEVHSKENQLHKITMHDKNGGTYTYLITKFLSNIKIKPFNFNPSDYPNVEVIDLR